MKLWKSKLSSWNRTIHRNLGYLMVGLCCVYGISGFLLNHMGDKDPAFTTLNETMQLPSGMNEPELAKYWNAKSDLPQLYKTSMTDEVHMRLLLKGGLGFYNTDTGIVDYETYRKNQFIYWINKLHSNKVEGWSIMADFFAFSLIFFAISGLFMVKGKNGIAKRGKWYLIVGLLIPVIYILIS